jgi:hypothetical protein
MARYARGDSQPERVTDERGYSEWVADNAAAFRN